MICNPVSTIQGLSLPCACMCVWLLKSDYFSVWRSITKVLFLLLLVFCSSELKGITSSLFCFFWRLNFKKHPGTNLHKLDFVLIRVTWNHPPPPHPAKKDTSWKKGKLNYESANVPPEVTAHGGNSSLSFQHQHLSSRSKSFLWLNIKRRQWCQGESNQRSIFGLQETLFAVR